MVKYLSQRKVGPHIKTLVCIYKSLVRSVLDYTSSVLMTTTKSNLQKLDSTQNKFLRYILQAFKSTPIEQLHLELGVEPLQYRRKYLATRYMAKKMTDNNRNPVQTLTYKLENGQNKGKERYRPSLLKAKEEFYK